MAVVNLLLRAHASDAEEASASHGVCKRVARELELFAAADDGGTALNLFRNARRLFRQLRDEAGPGGPRVDSTGPDGARTLTYTVSRQQHPDGGVFAAAVTVAIKGVVCHEEPFDFDKATAESVSFVVSPPATSAACHGVGRSAEGFTVSIGCANRRRDTCFPLSLLSTDDTKVPKLSVARGDANAPRLAESGLNLEFPVYRFLKELLAPPDSSQSVPVVDNTLLFEENSKLRSTVADLEKRMAGLEQTVRTLSGQYDSCRTRIDEVDQSQRTAERNCQAHIATQNKALCDVIAKCKRDVVESATAAQRASENRADESHAKTLRDTYRKIWQATDGRLRELTTFKEACWALEHHYATISPIVVGRRLYIIARGVDGIVGSWMSLDGNVQGSVPANSMQAAGADWKKPEFFRTWQVTSVADRYIVVAARQANALNFHVLDTSTKGEEKWKNFGSVDPLTEVEWPESKHYDTVQVAGVGTKWLVVVTRRTTGLKLWVASAETLGDPPPSPVWQEASAVLTGLRDAAGWGDPKFYRTIKLASGHDGKSLVCVARGPDEAFASEGLQAWRVDCETREFHVLSPPLGAFTTSSGWDTPEFYETAQFVAFSATSFLFIMRGRDGVFAYRLDVPERSQETAAWTAISMFPGRTNKGGWDKPQYYRTLRLVNRHTCSDVVLGSRAAAGAVATIFNTKTQKWRSMQMPSNNACFSDVAGFDQASCYETCRVVVDGADVFMCGRGTKGYHVQLLTPV